VGQSDVGSLIEAIIFDGDPRAAAIPDADQFLG
jgi:hypothetical protein